MAERPNAELLLMAYPPIVHVHPRAFPAVAVDGDTLSTWLDRIDEALGGTDTAAVLTELRSELSAFLDVYERALADRGIGLPYQPRA
jgi:hypothetical protein